LGYWKIRGLASFLRYQLAYCGVDCDYEEYEQGDGPGFDRSCWYNVKYDLGFDFPNLPYFVHGDIKLTESMAIGRYIAETWDETLMGVGPVQRANINMLADILCGINLTQRRNSYLPDKKDVVIKSIKGGGIPKIVNFMGKNKFLTGSEPAWIDFFFFEMVEYMQFIMEGKLYELYPTLEGYHKRMTDLPGLKEYLEDPDCPEKTR